MNALGQWIVIGMMSTAASVTTYFVKGAPARFYICDPATLKPGEICLEQISGDEDILWVDARLRKDWEKNGLPGSILWNLDPKEDAQTFEAETAMRVLETPRVIVYCGDENCGISTQVAERIRGLGMEADVSVLRGGWRALKDGGRIKDPTPSS